MEWPQITMIVLWTVAITRNTYNDGLEGMLASLAGTGIVATILYYGGFWS